MIAIVSIGMVIFLVIFIVNLPWILPEVEDKGK